MILAVILGMAGDLIICPMKFTVEEHMGEIVKYMEPDRTILGEERRKA